MCVEEQFYKEILKQYYARLQSQEYREKLKHIDLTRQWKLLTRFTHVQRTEKLTRHSKSTFISEGGGKRRIFLST